jgi:hypothetical protein
VAIDPNAPPDAQVAQGGGGGRGGRGGGGGPAIAPGRFTATLGKLNGDQFTAIGGPQSFQVLPLPGKNY